MQGLRWIAGFPWEGKKTDFTLPRWDARLAMDRKLPEGG
jgi:hypothetical protein